MPSLKKVRRIAASVGDSSFVGEFSYDDVSPKKVDRDTHTILREENLDGEACWVIQSVPHNPAGSNTSKSITWISKEKYLPLKIETYGKSGEIVKTLEVKKTEHIQSVWQ